MISGGDLHGILRGEFATFAGRNSSLLRMRLKDTRAPNIGRCRPIAHFSKLTIPEYVYDGTAAMAVANSFYGFIRVAENQKASNVPSFIQPLISKLFFPDVSHSTLGYGQNPGARCGPPISVHSENFRWLSLHKIYSA